MKFVNFFLFLALALCSTSHAQLKWEKRNLEFHPSVSDTQVVAEFPFANIGKKPVKIKDLKTSCGCTTATLDKEIYAPGEKGKITAIFEIGGRTGVQDKHVYVTSDDRKEPELVLGFKATIPKILDVDPIFINWTKDDGLKPRTVNIKVLGDFPVHHLEVTSTSPDMAFEVKHTEGSRVFQIILTPHQTKDGISAGIEINPDFPKNPPKYFHVYTRVDN